MNKKYERYIEYIVNDLEPPYFFNMENQYGLRPDEYELVLSRVFNQPVEVEGNRVFDKDNNQLYYETRDGYWYKQEYDNQGNNTYYETIYGNWEKYEYDADGNEIYFEDSDGFINDRR